MNAISCIVASWISYPVAAAMIQPPSSAFAWQQPGMSWLIPKLCPISCAIVAATPTDKSEWSCSTQHENFKISRNQRVILWLDACWCSVASSNLNLNTLVPHHVYSAGLVFGAHGFERCQPDGRAPEWLPPGDKREHLKLVPSQEHPAGLQPVFITVLRNDYEMY